MNVWDFVVGIIWESYLRDYCLFGWRPLLLIPIVLIPIFLLIIRKHKRLTIIAVLTNQSFLLSLLVTSVICTSVFLVLTNRTPSDTKFVIAISQFYPTSDTGAPESKNIRDRIIEGLKNRQSEYGVEVVIKDLRETIKPASENGLENAKTLGRHYAAHMVICGKVRIDEEYYFEPAIISLIPLEEQRHQIELSYKGGSLILSPGLAEKDRLRLKKQKVAQVGDFVTFIFGLSKYERKDFQQAQNIFESMKIQTAESFFYRAKCWSQLKDYDTSLLFLDKAVKLNPNYLDAWLKMGSIYFATKNYDKAEVVLSKATTLKPGYDSSALPLAWTLKGFVLLVKNKQEQAIEMFDKAITLKSDQAWSWMGKSLATMMQGIEVMGNALLHNNGDSFNSNQKIDIISKMQSKFREATIMCNRALNLEPNQAYLWLCKSLLLMVLPGLEEEALIACDKAIKLQPDLVEAWEVKALVLLRLGRDKEALSIAEKLDSPKERELIKSVQTLTANLSAMKSEKSEKPAVQTAQELVFKGDALLSIGELDKASTVYFKAIALKRDYAEAWLGLASISYNRGTIDLAFEQCERAIAFKVDYAKAWWLKGIILLQKGKLEAARDAYDEAIRIAPDYVDDLWVARGNLLMLMGEYDMALSSHEKAIGLKADHGRAWLGKYEALLALGRRKEALVAYNKAIRIDPDLAWREYPFLR